MPSEFTPSHSQLRNFESAFGTPGAGCRRECHCGRWFFDYHNQWDWSEGELEGFQSDPKATGLGHAVSTLMFEGREYVTDCDCWHKRASRIIEWLHENFNEVAAFMNAERSDRIAAAQSLIQVETDPYE